MVGAVLLLALGGSSAAASLGLGRDARSACPSVASDVVSSQHSFLLGTVSLQASLLPAPLRAISGLSLRTVGEGSRLQSRVRGTENEGIAGTLLSAVCGHVDASLYDESIHFWGPVSFALCF